MTDPAPAPVQEGGTVPVPPPTLRASARDGPWHGLLDLPLAG